MTTNVVAAIEAMLQDLLSKGRAGDFEGWLAFFSEDIVLMPPNSKIVEGKAAARQWAQPLFDQFTVNETSSFDEVKIIGDWAFGRGVYEADFVPKKEGDTIHEKGKFIYMFERQADKSWKLARCIWNSDIPQD